MYSLSASNENVLIVGAGPTGMAIAISLLSRGHEVTIVDKLEEGNNTSRAAVVYPATLEVLNPFGVAERLIVRSIRSPRFTIRDRDRILMPVPFDKLPTEFPYTLLVSQAVTEAVLLERLKELGGHVLRPWTLTRLEQDETAATAIFADGKQIRAAFVVGADGVHSTVREQAGIASDREKTGASYTLADVHLTGGAPDDELVVYFSSAGHLVVLPLSGGIHRMVAHVDEAPEHPDVSFLQQVIETRGPERERAVVHDVIWGSRFFVKHALASTYRAGRVFLAGDAAHEHSPLGGQGMNLGINDAVVLGRALAESFEKHSPDRLDGYSSIRRPVAEQVISVTDLLTKVATVPEHLRLIRNLAVGGLSPVIRNRLAWRLSLLGSLEQNRSNRVEKKPNDARANSPPKAA
jgi:2-polyprenyl-6-methoxyphenol hydroxylase-like FAD-dependent oxidoreductase